MAEILVVDDDPDIRQFIQDGLAQNDYASEPAANGLEAIGKLRANAYRLVILDILMPEADGLEVLKALQEEGAGEKPKVIGITGGGRSLPGWYSGQLAVASGVETVLYKPFSLDEMISTVASVLDGT